MKKICIALVVVLALTAATAMARPVRNERSPALRFDQTTHSSLLEQTMSKRAPALNTKRQVRMHLSRAQVPLKRCRAARDFLCGKVPVPLDRANPSGEKLGIAFEILPGGRGSQRRAPVFVTHGGPGLSTTGDRFFWVFLLEPLLAKRDLVLIDTRGTGKSGVLRCPGVQEGWDSVEELKAEIGECGASLGDAADRYGSGDIARDINAVRRALGYPKINYVGGSYATVAQQAYAVRFPQRIRSIVADAGLTVTDPTYDWAWGWDVPPSLIQAITLHCQRAPSCAAAHPNPAELFASLVERVADEPVVGTGHDPFGNPVDVVIGEPELAAIVRHDPFNPGEIAAVATALEQGDPEPLIRLGAETPNFPGHHGPPRILSMGAYAATYCNDQDFEWDRSDTPAERAEAFEAAVAGLDPDAFAPFSLDGWIEYFWPDGCEHYPAPDRFEPAVPEGATFTDAPVLILSGDFDTDAPTALTDNLAGVFPDSQLVEIAGAGHTAMGWSPCAVNLAARLVNRLRVGNTSCAQEPSAVLPAVPKYPLTSDAATPAEPIPGSYDTSTTQDRRVAAVATHTVLDAFLRSVRQPVPDASGAGLRGGTFDAFYNRPRNAKIVHNDLMWVEDVVLSGRSLWAYSNQNMVTTIDISGSGTDPGELRIEGVWGDPYSQFFTITGTIGGREIALRMPTN